LAITLLLVAADEDFLAVLDVVLARNGYGVVRCSAPEEMALYAKQWRPAAILLDLQGPEGNMLRLIEQLKSDPHTAGIPIIACIAHDLDSKLVFAALQELGCALLPMPFELDDLLHILPKD
jgi:CheY-like chemotaxis protein